MGKGFDTFMANPYWRRIYAEAPSERLKEYYRLRYEISPFVMGEDYRDETAEQRLQELLLTKSDIEYIRQFAGSGIAKHYYEKFIQKLTGEHEGRSFPAVAFQVEIWNPWYEESHNPQYEGAPVGPGFPAHGDRRAETPAEEEDAEAESFVNLALEIPVSEDAFQRIKGTLEQYAGQKDGILVVDLAGHPDGVSYIQTCKSGDSFRVEAAIQSSGEHPDLLALREASLEETIRAFRRVCVDRKRPTEECWENVTDEVFSAP